MGKTELALNTYTTKSLTTYTAGLLEAFEQAGIKEKDYTDAITETDRFPRLQKIPVVEWMIGWIHGVAEAHGVSVLAVWYRGLCLVGEKVNAADKAARKTRRKAA